MNIDLNPLSEYHNYTIYHILVAYQYSRDAYTTPLVENIGPTGTEFVGKECGGKCVVLINEFTSQQANVDYCETDWSFFSPVTSRTTSYVGAMEIVDRSGFLFAETLKQFTQKLDTSVHHLTMAWKPVFVCKKPETSVTDVIHVNPLHFHVTKFSQNVSGDYSKSYHFEFAAAYNTHGMAPQFAKLYQTTITTSEGNVINSNPTPIGATSGIKSTRAEDSAKLTLRKSRLEKTKYMKTIGDMLKGLETTLDNQKANHKKQLQRFLSIIRDEYVDKIRTAKQERGELPLDYSIEVDDYYKGKKINNRNLPFEQVEIDQRIPGVSSITVPNGTSIHSAIDMIMRMSTEVAQDYEHDPATTYKTTITTNRECSGQYKIHTKVKKYVAAYNSTEGTDSGPGNGVIGQNIIQYEYQDRENRDNNLISVSYASLPEYKLNALESVEEQQDTQDVYGNREQISVERFGKVKNFFSRGFTGLRSLTGMFTNNGLENPTAMSNVTNFREHQQTSYVLKIVGNPHLFNDINRNPLDVVSNTEVDGVGKYIIYSNVETDPMYVKLKIHLTGSTVLGHTDDTPLTPLGTFYYDGHLHLYKINNVFTPGAFFQHLTCGRTEESI